MRLLLAVLIVMSLTFAATNISNCGDITIAGNYTLNQNFTASGDCLNVTASANIDGMGYTIIGSGTGFGIKTNALGVNISNITLSGFTYGVYENQGRSGVFNSSISNSTDGIFCSGVPPLYIINNSINATNSSIVVSSGAGSLMHIITNNTLYCTGQTHFHYCLDFIGSTSSNFNVSRNNITQMNASNYAVSLSAVTNMTFYDNYIIQSSKSYVFTLTISNVTFNITKQAGTNIIGGTNIGGNYWANTILYDTDNDSIANTAMQVTGTNYDYLPLSNSLGGYFVSPTPDYGSTINTTTLQIRFNFTIVNMTSCTIQVYGINRTGVFIGSDNTTCEANFTLDPGFTYPYTAYANVSGTIYPANETRIVCFQTCNIGGGGIPPSLIQPETVTENQTTQNTTETPPPPTYPDPTANPDFYTNPPFTVGQAGGADAIVEATNGKIEQLPYVCEPTIQKILPFIGSEILDRVICEIKGLQSLYLKIWGGVLNFSLIGLLFLVYIAREQKNSTGKNIMAVITILFFVSGIQFLAFSFTAFVLAAGNALRL